MRSLVAFLRLSRPHFLVGGFLMFGVGAASASEIDATGYALGQAMVTAAQVTAHYVNEYADVEADRLVKNRTFFSGGSGVLPFGTLDTSVALRAAWVSSAVAMAAAIVLAFQAPTAAAIGVLALAISWSYSMPPLRLVGTGWGELATSLVVAGAVPLIGLTSQGVDQVARLWWSIAILVPIHFAMMLVFELPDLHTDTAAGKRVLAVRVGRDRTVQLIIALLLGAVAIAVAAVAVDGLPTEAGWWTAAAIVPASATMAVNNRIGNGLITASAVATLTLAAVGLLISLNR